MRWGDGSDVWELVRRSGGVSRPSPRKGLVICHVEMACFSGFLGFLGGFNLMDRLECR